MQAGNYGKALEAFARALESSPGFPPAHVGLGHVALAGQDFAGALREYTVARLAYGEFGNALYQIEVGRYSKAQDQIRSMNDELRELRNRARGPANEAGLSTTQQNMERTLEQRIQTLQAIPLPTPDADVGPPADVYFHTGNALFRLERYDEARIEWEACAEKNPAFPLVRNNLAVLYLKAGRFDDARRAVAEAERLGMTVNPALKADIERAADALIVAQARAVVATR